MCPDQLSSIVVTYSSAEATDSIYMIHVSVPGSLISAGYKISGKVRHLRLWKKLLYSLVIYLTFSQFQPIQISAYACICTLPECPSLDRERSGILVLMRKLKCRASTSNSVFCARYCVLMLFVFCGLYWFYLLFTSVLWIYICFFWYRPTRVVPDQRPLNGRCCCCCFRNLSLVVTVFCKIIDH